MTNTLEIHAAVELHADPGGPGRLTGCIATYGETSRDARRHVFEAGSLKWDSSGVVLNRQHTRGAPITRITPMADGDRIVIDHVLPDTAAGRDAAAEIRSGLMTGLSAEVRVGRDQHDAGRRLILEAELVGVGLVDRAAFESTGVSVHERQPAQRRRIWL